LNSQIAQSTGNSYRWLSDKIYAKNIMSKIPCDILGAIFDKLPEHQLVDALTLSKETHHSLCSSSMRVHVLGIEQLIDIIISVPRNRWSTKPLPGVLQSLSTSWVSRLSMTALGFDFALTLSSLRSLRMLHVRPYDPDEPGLCGTSDVIAYLPSVLTALTLSSCNSGILHDPLNLPRIDEIVPSLCRLSLQTPYVFCDTRRLSCLSHLTTLRLFTCDEGSTIHPKPRYLITPPSMIRSMQIDNKGFILGGDTIVENMTYTGRTMSFMDMIDDIGTVLSSLLTLSVYLYIGADQRHFSCLTRLTRLRFINIDGFDRIYGLIPRETSQESLDVGRSKSLGCLSTLTTLTKLRLCMRDCRDTPPHLTWLHQLVSLEEVHLIDCCTRLAANLPKSMRVYVIDDDKNKKEDHENLERSRMRLNHEVDYLMSK
jgi:hypothetical protein